jgi:hypothetical protein
MSELYDPLEEAFNEELGDGFAYESEGFVDGFGEGLGESFGEFEEEGDAFFGKIFKSLGRLVKNLPLKQLAQRGAQIAGGALGGPVGAMVGTGLGSLLGEEELEGEYESEYEDGPLQEDRPEAFGLDSLSDSLAESLAAQAAESESESESSALLGGVTIHIVTRAPVSVRRVAPVLVKSANRLGRYLRKRPRTRPLVKAIPKIQKTAVKMLANHAMQGGKVTPAIAAKAMAKATVKTLGTPTAAAKSLANNAIKSRRVASPSGGRLGPNYKGAIARAER